MQKPAFLFAEVRMRSGLTLPRTWYTSHWGKWLACREEADDQWESLVLKEIVWS